MARPKGLRIVVGNSNTTTVTFTPSSNQTRGFDATPAQGEKKSDLYFETSTAGTRIAWKSLEPGRPDRVKFSKADNLTFEQESGAIVTENCKDLGNCQVIYCFLTNKFDRAISSNDI